MNLRLAQRGFLESYRFDLIGAPRTADQQKIKYRHAAEYAEEYVPLLALHLANQIGDIRVDFEHGFDLVGLTGNGNIGGHHVDIADAAFECVELVAKSDIACRSAAALVNAW